MKKHLSWAILIVLFGFAFSAWAYQLLPESIAIHWNAQGTSDGYGGRGFVFLMPAVSLLMVALLWSIPSIDPRKKNVEKFRDTYDRFILVFAGFMTYLGMLTIAANLGWIENIAAYMAPALGALLYTAGSLMEKSRSSWFIGVRTPWTLSSETVWEKTNKLGGRTLKYIALLMAIGMIFLPKMLLALIVIILAWAIGIMAYSYFAWKQENN